MHHQETAAACGLTMTVLFKVEIYRQSESRPVGGSSHFCDCSYSKNAGDRHQ